MLRYASSRWVMGAAAGHLDEMEMEMDDITLIIHCDDGTGKCTGMRCPARDRERHDMNDERAQSYVACRAWLFSERLQFLMSPLATRCSSAAPTAIMALVTTTQPRPKSEGNLVSTARMISPHQHRHSFVCPGPGRDGVVSFFFSFFLFFFRFSFFVGFIILSLSHYLLGGMSSGFLEKTGTTEPQKDSMSLSAHGLTIHQHVRCQLCAAHKALVTLPSSLTRR